MASDRITFQINNDRLKTNVGEQLRDSQSQMMTSYFIQQNQ